MVVVVMSGYLISTKRVNHDLSNCTSKKTKQTRRLSRIPGVAPGGESDVFSAESIRYHHMWTGAPAREVLYVYEESFVEVTQSAVKARRQIG
jgi:hypothetical protein